MLASLNYSAVSLLPNEPLTRNKWYYWLEMPVDLENSNEPQ